jgi:hypothetical protein
MVLTFTNGRMTGEGNDIAGPFIISGGYDPASKECHWTKTYIRQHDVAYTGFREGKGILGTWDIESIYRGGFHIWPLADDAGMEEMASEEETREQPIAIPSAPQAAPASARHMKVSISAEPARYKVSVTFIYFAIVSLGLALCPPGSTAQGIV